MGRIHPVDGLPDAALWAGELKVIMMKRIMYLSLILAALMLLSGCVGFVSTKQDVYPKMYPNPPVSIMILPPVNNSTAADAKEYFACSLSEALGRKGYYVMPVEAVFGVLRDEGMYDTENINPTVLANLKKNFGADAVLYTTIERWDKSWILVAGSLDIVAKFSLLSTTTGETLWDYTTETTVNLGSEETNFLAAAIETAIKTAVEDYFPNCLKANIMTMDTAMPYGKHHPKSGLDGKDTMSAAKLGRLEINK